MMDSAVSRILAEAPQKFSQSPQGRMAAPTGIWDHMIVLASVVLVLIAVYLCIRFFLSPSEEDRGHIKHRILNDHVDDRTGDDDAR